MAPSYIDITGQRFGKLTVLRKSNIKSTDGKYLWECECDCGNIVYRRYYQLNQIKERGCGECINTYEEKNDYMIGYTNNGKQFFFDKDDFEKIKKHNWHMNGHGYIQTGFKENGKKRVIQMHRYLLDAPNDKVVDHINHMRNDNRKSNLRICTRSQNSLNKKVKGYTLRKNGKYDVGLNINGVNTFIGSFYTKEEALQARWNAYDEEHKKYCYDEKINLKGIIK